MDRSHQMASFSYATRASTNGRSLPSTIFLAPNKWPGGPTNDPKVQQMTRRSSTGIDPKVQQMTRRSNNNPKAQQSGSKAHKIIKIIKTANISINKSGINQNNKRTCPITTSFTKSFNSLYRFLESAKLCIPKITFHILKRTSPELSESVKERGHNPRFCWNV